MGEKVHFFSPVFGKVYVGGLETYIVGEV